MARRRITGQLAAVAVLLLPLVAGTSPALAAAAQAQPPEPRPTGQFCAGVPAGFQPFTDVAGNTHEAAIACAAFAEVTRGGPGTSPAHHYGPGLDVRRGQMASFVARVMDLADELDTGDRIAALPPYGGSSTFTDVPASHPHVEAVNRLAQAGIVQGGPGGRTGDEYGPELTTHRDQMASFLNRAVGFLTGERYTSTVDHFDDDEASVHQDNINGVAQAGIAVGVGDRRYRPGDQVRRDQMASFLVRTQAALHADGRTGDVGAVTAAVVQLDRPEERVPAGQAVTGTIWGVDDATSVRASGDCVVEGELTDTDPGRQGLQFSLPTRDDAADGTCAVTVETTFADGSTETDTFEVVVGEDDVVVQPGRWESLPGAPIEPRLNSSATWAGDRLVVWGGGSADTVHADGAAWIPAEQRWQLVPAAPIAPRWAHEAVWTGNELIVWGGSEGPDHLAECYTDGARYRPATGTWHPMAQAPGEGRCGALVVWANGRMLVFGGAIGGGPPGTDEALHDDGLAYDPATDTWTEIPSAPLEPRSGVAGGWSGSELVVWGGTGARSEPVGGGAAYDPASGTWRSIAAAPLPPRAAPAGAFADGELVVFGGRDLDTGDYLLDAAAYDPQADTWRELPDLPAPQVAPETAWDGSDVLYVVGGDGRPQGTDEGAFLTYVPAQDRWSDRITPPGGARTNHAVAWSGSRLYVWGGQTTGGSPAPGIAWQPPA